MFLHAPLVSKTACLARAAGVLPHHRGQPRSELLPFECILLISTICLPFLMQELRSEMRSLASRCSGFSMRTAPADRDGDCSLAGCGYGCGCCPVLSSLPLSYRNRQHCCPPPWSRLTSTGRPEDDSSITEAAEFQETASACVNASGPLSTLSCSFDDFTACGSCATCCKIVKAATQS